jgi:hypothetical protein
MWYFEYTSDGRRGKNRGTEEDRVRIRQGESRQEGR